MILPKISVITVCLNKVAVIEQTIKSVLDQSYPNIEYIIIDGGSDDGTTEILKNYHRRITKWISEPDAGIYDAMNKGTAMASGDWLYFLGAGDILLNAVDKVIPHLTRKNRICYGDVYRKDLEKVYDGKYSGYKLAVTNICHQAIFYPALVFKKYAYETKYKMLADHHLNMRCYGDKKLTFKYMRLQIAIYEGDGLSDRVRDEEFYKDKITVIRQNFSFLVYLYAYARRSLAGFLKNKN